MKQSIKLLAVIATLATIITSCDKDDITPDFAYGNGEENAAETHRNEEQKISKAAESKVIFYYSYDYSAGTPKKVSADNPISIYGDEVTVYLYADAPDTLKWAMPTNSATIFDSYGLDLKYANGADKTYSSYNGETITGPASFALTYANGARDGYTIDLKAISLENGVEIEEGAANIVLKYARLRVQGTYICSFDKKNETTYYVRESLSFNIYYGSVLKEENVSFYFTAGTAENSLTGNTYTTFTNETEIDASLCDTWVGKWDPSSENPEYSYLKTLNVKASYGFNDNFFNEKYVGMDITRSILR